MELKDYIRILRRHWMTVVACTLLGVLSAALLSLLIKPTYTASTQLFVAIQNAGTVTELQQGNSFSQARVQSYVKTATTPSVLQPVIDSLGLTTTPDELASQVRASADLNTVLINVAVEDESPSQAAAIAQAISSSLMQTIESLEAPEEKGPSPVRLSIVTPASVPLAPSDPNTPLNLLLGAALGLAAGLGLALLRTTLDTRVRGEEDVRRLVSWPMLGGISFDSAAASTPLLTEVGQQSQRAEAFRQIRTNLQFSKVDSESRSVLITSSVPGEGKSTSAINLAITLAQTGQKVVLVDADLRRPMVAEYLGLERHAGLTTALVGRAELQDLLQPWGPDKLFVLTAGQIPPNPSELLGSASMTELIRKLEVDFDAVIIDAPPLLPVTDAAVLSQAVGGVVLVVGSHQIKSSDLEKSAASLSLVSANVLGFVINKLPIKGPDAYEYSYYSYASALLDTKDVPHPGVQDQGQMTANSIRGRRVSVND